MGEIDVLYDRFGVPTFRLLDNGRLVTFRGKSAGFMLNDSLYDYRGRHVGWFSEGIVRDHHGNVVGFGENVSDPAAPFLPFKRFKPFPGFVEFEPFRPFTQFEPFRPFKSFRWSPIPLENLFN